MKRRRKKPAFVVKQGSAIVVAYGPDRRHRFCLTYKKHAGAKRTRETRTGEKAARARALEVAIAIANGRAETLELTNADRESYLHAKSILPAGIPLHNAIEEWNSARRELGTNSLSEAVAFFLNGRKETGPKITTATVVERLLDSRKSDPDSNYVTRMRNDLAPFAARFPILANAATQDIRHYLRELKVGNRRFNNVRAKIVTLSRFATTKEGGFALPANEVTPAERIAVLDVFKTICVWTPAELRLLLGHVSEKWLPWMALGAFAGVRPSEIFRLDWSMFKWDRRVIKISGSAARKTTRPRNAEITDALYHWLSPYHKAVGPIYDFGKEEDPADVERNRLKEKLGITWKTDGFRHSYITYRLAQTANIEQVSRWAGNSPRVIEDDYDALGTREDADEYFSIRRGDVSNIVQMKMPGVM